MLNISGLSISYGPVQVVHGVSMNVDEGQIVALIGPNGAGKSSLLQAVSGLIRPKAGDISFLGASLVGAPPHEIAMAGISHVMEGRHLFGGLTVEDNLILAGSRDEQGSASNLESVYQRWPRLRERREQLAGTLSGGEQQMLAIGRALMSRPRLMILDEPSWGLAPRTVRELMDTCVKLRQGGMTILLCEQMANLALKICDYAYVMTTGRIVLEGTSQKLLADPDLQATYLGGEIGETSPSPSPYRQEDDVQAGIPRKTLAALPATEGEPARHSLIESQVDRAGKERARHEHAQGAQSGTVGLRELALKPGSLIEEDRRAENYTANERRRKMKAREFEAGEQLVDLKEELLSFRKEISKSGTKRSGIKLDQASAAETSESPRPDRITLETIRKRQQKVHQDPGLATATGLKESLAETRSMAVREQARSEREAAVRRQLHLEETDPEHRSDRARQEAGSGRVERPQKDRGRLEEQRRLRQSTYQSELTNVKPTGKPEPEKFDRKLRELQRRQKQAKESGSKERNPS